MSELYLLTSITDRRLLASQVSLLQENNVSTSLITLGRGMISGDRKGYFVDRTQKAVVFSMVTWKTWREVRHGLEQKLKIDLPGAGVAFLTPLSAIGGRRELAFFMDGQDFVRGGESELKGTERELLVVVCNQGYSEMVMDAAREAGANGGTVINARGTGMEKAEKFLGISLASEKDMTFIVVRTAVRDHVMQSIMLKAGVATEAKAIVFSLPVTDTAGLRLADAAEEAEPAAGEPAPQDKAGE